METRWQQCAWDITLGVLWTDWGPHSVRVSCCWSAMSWSRWCISFLSFQHLGSTNYYVKWLLCQTLSMFFWQCFTAKLTQFSDLQFFRPTHSLSTHISTLYTCKQGILQAGLTREACSHSSFCDRPWHQGPGPSWYRHSNSGHTLEAMEDAAFKVPAATTSSTKGNAEVLVATSQWCAWPWWWHILWGCPQGQSSCSHGNVSQMTNWNHTATGY